MAHPVLGQVPGLGGSSQGVRLHLHGACQQCHLYIRDLAVSTNPPPAPPRAIFFVMTGISLLISITSHVYEHVLVDFLKIDV